MKKVGAGIALALLASTVPMAANAAKTTSSATADKPVSGGKITVGVFDTFAGYCMKQILANSALGGARSIAETLFERNSSGKVVPFLLKGVTPSADNKTWNLEIRKKADGTPIQFSDGAAWNADALIANFNAIRGLTYVANIKTDTEKNFLGSTAVATGNIVSTTKVDDYNVTVKLNMAQADLRELMYASGRFIMRSPNMFKDSASCASTLVGTGPFVQKSSEPTKLVVVKNKNYWRKDAAGNKLPYLDQSASRVAGLKSGSLDAAQFSSASETKQMKDLSTSTAVSYFKTGGDFYPSLWFNTSIAPFNNLNARKAVSFALDRDLWAKTRGNGMTEAATSIVGKNNVMYSKTNFASFNLAKAKAAAAAYRAETDKDLEFVFPSANDSSTRANSKAFVAMMKKAGIKASFNEELISDIVNKGFFEAGTGLKYQAAFLLTLEGLDAAFNYIFLSSNMFETGTTNPMAGLARLGKIDTLLNITKHKDTQLDALLQAARASGTAADYKKVTERIQDQAYIANITYQTYAMATTKKIHGIGETKLAAGGSAPAVFNWGTNWTSVWKK
jgi:peptide/nickel transport system substrate-binding protein